MPVTYTKPHLTVDEQVELLRSRRLVIDDRQAAARWLRMVGYYRLSGYWYPYRQLRPGSEHSAGQPIREDHFVDGTTFEQITDLYEFDRRLKLLALEAVERIEISMRFRVGYTLGRRGAFAHLDPANLDASFDAPRSDKPSRYAEWCDRLASEQARSSEDFVLHFRAKYSDQLPVWVATEILDFGGLSVLYSGLKRTDRDLIAAELAILDSAGAGNGRALANWMQVLNYIRNTCAHHSRLWNRNLTVQVSPKQMAWIPKLAHLRSSAASTTARLFSAVCVLDFLMTGIDPAHTWTADVCALATERLPLCGRDIGEMGFPTNWSTLLA